MKKWFGLMAILLSSYIIFIGATAPITLLLNNVSYPKNVNLSGVTGTIWQFKIEQLNVGDIKIENVSAKLSFLSLLSLSPEVKLTFGDALLSGPEGKVTVNLSRDELTISSLALFVVANDVVSQVTLPLPATAQGNVDLLIEKMTFSYSDNNVNTLKCTDAIGEFSWKGAGVIAMEQNIKLGTFKADIRCEDDAVMVVVNPKNNLGLSFNLYARLNKRLSGDGYLKPGNKFPQQLQGALPFLGKKDDQGRYRLKF